MNVLVPLVASTFDMILDNKFSGCFAQSVGLPQHAAHDDVALIDMYDLCGKQNVIRGLLPFQVNCLCVTSNRTHCRIGCREQ